MDVLVEVNGINDLHGWVHDRYLRRTTTGSTSTADEADAGATEIRRERVRPPEVTVAAGG